MGTLNTILQKLRHGLIVSCQALPGEPLHGAEIMARMAAAAEEGGAVGIRANGSADIRAIKSAVSLPVIGIIKRDYPGSEVYITPTLREIDELLEAGADMIAFDATRQKRPGDSTLEQIVAFLHRSGTASMADISILEEAVHAEALGSPASRPHSRAIRRIPCSRKGLTLNCCKALLIVCPSRLLRKAE